VLGATEPWKTRAPNKCRFFVWVVPLNRCWTAERLHRHGIRSNEDCILYYQEVETVDHMMVQCVFPREVWFKSLRRCGWQELALAPDSCFAAWWTFVRKRVHRPCCKAFDSLILAVAWGIWNQSRVFRSSSQCASSVVDTIWSSVGLWCRAVLVDRSHLLALQFTFCLLRVGPLFQIPSFFNAKCAIARSQKKYICVATTRSRTA
jgi:hypothetical protein